MRAYAVVSFVSAGRLLLTRRARKVFEAGRCHARRPRSQKLRARHEIDRQRLAPRIQPFSATMEPGQVEQGRGRVRGGLSVDFLGVVGALATLVGAALLPFPLLYGALRGGGGRIVAGTGATGSPPLAVVACMSASYGIVLSRFDLHLLRRLKLTLAFALLTRFICVPLIAHFLSLVVSSVTSSVAKQLASPVALSSLLLISLAPVGYSPSVAMLSPFLYPTLFAHLTLVTLLLFPALPAVSYAVNVLLRQMPLFGTAPLVAPPPSVLSLFLATTCPVLLSIIASRKLPQRWVAVGGLFALPTAWACSAFLVGSSLAGAPVVGVAGLLGSIALCGGIVTVMIGLGLLLSALLGLDTRAKRTLILYLCSQGSAVASGLAPSCLASATSASAAILGIILTLIFSKRWSKVVVRTSGDHL